MEAKAQLSLIEQQLARVGVDLPRVCQVSLMAQLDRLVEPLLKALAGVHRLDGQLMVVLDVDRVLEMAPKTVLAA